MKETRLGLRISEEEKEDITRAADALGQTIARYVLDSVRTRMAQTDDSAVTLVVSKNQARLLLEIVRDLEGQIE